MSTSILYDIPGPRTRLRNNVYALLGAIGLIVIAYFVYSKFDQAGQWSAKLWTPFIDPQVWTGQILPGLAGTLSAALVAAILSLLFGVVFGLGRLSEHRWLRLPSATIVEFFRSIPVLMMIFFAQAGAFDLFGYTMSAFTAVVIGLTLYNGSVLAEVFRAGITSIPRGQAEAAYAIGLRKSGVIRLILLPQAVTAMMPAIVSQMVVVLKDTALGYIIAYEELLNTGFRQLPATFANIVPAAIVIAAIYILINLGLGQVAHWLERRSRRSRLKAPRTSTRSTIPQGTVT
ncbi:amino acid ABC transporter permease [Sphaerisporangium melleum]|uniref:Amino acid ABC transporter permease n=1 Tax=Sphaerisporangium melleum TaxID=321316 RepID=A0A917R1J8_9ACTN|nr:amino acid ABC transporter permease [Sphaerisporangium melleum]GGK82914.1 amino acid ABC transporter permease [Sphaerisporangium melleum]GII69215.1 amino acid ABC transporter permease [Sphaerisporangium melleum]